MASRTLTIWTCDACGRQEGYICDGLPPGFGTVRWTRKKGDQMEPDSDPDAVAMDVCKACLMKVYAVLVPGNRYSEVCLERLEA